MASLNVITNRSSAPKLKWVLVIFIVLLGAVTLGVIAAQQPLLAIAGGLGVLLLMVLLKWPDTATLLFIFYIYTNVGPVAMNFHGVPSYIAMGFPVILIIPLVWHVLLRREK